MMNRIVGLMNMAVAMVEKAVVMGRFRDLSKQTRHILVGGAVVMTGAIALVLSQSGGASKAGGGYELTGHFGSIDGVATGTKVLLAGIQVGEVVGRAYEPDRQRAVLVMSMRSDIQIPLDSVAMIVSDGLMGNKYVKLQVGGEVEMMRDGDVFEYVQDSIIFEEILEKVILNAEQKRRKQDEEEKKPEIGRDEAWLRESPAADAMPLAPDGASKP